MDGAGSMAMAMKEMDLVLQMLQMLVVGLSALSKTRAFDSPFAKTRRRYRWVGQTHPAVGF